MYYLSMILIVSAFVGFSSGLDYAVISLIILACVYRDDISEDFKRGD